MKVKTYLNLLFWIKILEGKNTDKNADCKSVGSFLPLKILLSTLNI